MQLPADELKLALLGLRKAMNLRSQLSALHCVRLAPDHEGVITLQATDLDSHVTYRFPGVKAPDWSPVLLKQEVLSRLIKSARQAIELTRNEQGQVILHQWQGTTRFERVVSTVPIDEWPLLATINTPDVSVQPDFKETFRQALECVSDDPTRSVLGGVCVDVSQSNGHYLVGTDGRHLFSANSFQLPVATSAIVPPRPFLKWTGLDEDGDWAIAVQPVEPNDGWFQIRSPHWTFVTKTVSGLYPNWRQAVPAAQRKESKIELTPDAASFLQRVVPGLPCLDSQHQGVQLEVRRQTLIVCGRNESQQQEIPVPGVTIAGPARSVTLNREYLLKALRFGLHSLGIEDGLSPVVFRSGGRQMVVMPLRPDPPAAATASPVNSPNPTPPQEATESASPSAIRSITPTDEPAPMSNPNTNPVMTPRPNSDPDPNAFRQAMAQIDDLKNRLREMLGQLGETTTLLKSAEKEQKVANREIDGVRAKLRELQSVTL